VLREVRCAAHRSLHFVAMRVMVMARVAAVVFGVVVFGVMVFGVVVFGVVVFGVVVFGAGLMVTAALV